MAVPADRTGGRLPPSAGIILGVICFLWGAQAVSIKFSNQGMPPIMAGALRSLVAGILGWVYARMRGRGVAFPPGNTRHALTRHVANRPGESDNRGLQKERKEGTVSRPMAIGQLQPGKPSCRRNGKAR